MKAWWDRVFPRGVALNLRLEGWRKWVVLSASILELLFWTTRMASNFGASIGSVPVLVLDVLTLPALILMCAILIGPLRPNARVSHDAVKDPGARDLPSGRSPRGRDRDR
jgi:hypothetical protein